MISIQYASILLLSISLTNAVSLHGNCTENSQCTVPYSICQGDTCQCNTPFYKPCNAFCDAGVGFSYEGGDCEAPENCIGNTVCQDKKCRCGTGYTPKNGVCFKNLGSSCSIDPECWSGFCLQSVCACQDGYTPVDNTTCQRSLVAVSNNWDEANRTTSFCTSDFSCEDIIAKCVIDPAHPQWKYCKCPDGYTIEQANDRRQCKATIGENLSPFDAGLPNGYVECGQCADENAVCISATNIRTCWCRAGYEKRGDKCEPRGKVDIVFPNLGDLQKHDYTVGCSLSSDQSVEIKNQLCACAPDYKFDPKDRSCKKIQLTWIDSNLEYGLCTHVNSNDEARPEEGVCPEPLKCLPKDDKHVCSCGKDKYQDLDDPTRCVNFIGTGANTTDRICPANTDIGTGNCVCIAGYAKTADDKRCELKLSQNVVDGSCNSSLGASNICQGFGVTASLCSTGECRCSGSGSFPNAGSTRCYAPLNTALSGTIESCPPVSNLIGSICTCTAGFRPTSDLKRCVDWPAQLIEYRGPPAGTSGDLRTIDCKALFTGPVEVYSDDSCQCKNNTFIDQDGTGCVYQLNIQLPGDNESLFCPPNTDYTQQKCICKAGYQGSGIQCNPITNELYEFNDATGVDVSGVNDNACRNLFGWGTAKSPNGLYCACLSNAYLITDKKVCHFYINRNSTDIKRYIDCPVNAELYPPGQSSVCKCKDGYRVTSDDKYCVRAGIPLIGSEIDDGTSNCSNFDDSDCTGLYGGEAFCKNDNCYCNRQTSFVNGQRCEPFANYRFPGEHELDLYTCEEDDDCTGKGTVTCDYISRSWGYKVCRCQDGTYLNSETQTCEDNRCTGCNTASNFECRDYVCQCKDGYVQDGNACKPETPLVLYQQCNRAIFRGASPDQSIVCDPGCNHAQCNYGYRPEKLECVPPKLSSDQCVHREPICLIIDPNSFCNRDDNHCSCRPSYYGTEDNKCARAVGYECTNDDQCGIGECKARRCACKEGQHTEDAHDVFNRPMKRCVANSGIGKIPSNPVLLLLFVLACMLFN